jgi:hypothetical protein
MLTKNETKLCYLLKFVSKEFLDITTSYLNNTIVYTNETVRCQAEGSRYIQVSWIRSGVVLVNKTSTAEITITENNGEYVCLASNREGIKKMTVKAKGNN